MFFEEFDANISWNEISGHTHDDALTSFKALESDSEGYAGIMNEALEFILTNLEDGAISDWESGASDWEEEGVFRAFWQADEDDSLLWQTSSLSPRGYIYYPK